VRPPETIGHLGPVFPGADAAAEIQEIDMSLQIVRTAVVAATLLLVSAFTSTPAWAGKADVLKVKSECKEDKCRFLVTVRHDDEGWKHYANRWEVLDLEGNILTTRVLTHPHVDEQPFARGKGWTVIPVEFDRVRVRAHDSVHAYGGEEVEVELER
jgi:hypothetical protein